MTNVTPPTRRAVTGWLVTAALAGLATQAAARGNDISPTDRLPRHYSLRRFTSLSRDEVYRIDHAARRGRPITIGDFSPSESRKILRDALADWPATRQSLLR